jgi:hypothetical protein
MRIESPRRPYDSWLLVIGIFILGGVVAQFMPGYTWVCELIPISIIIFISTSNTFTLAVTLTEQQVEVEYIQYLRKRKVVFDRKRTRLILEKHEAYTGKKPKISYLLRIFCDGEVKYVVNSQEGFSEKGLFDLANMHKV